MTLVILGAESMGVRSLYCQITLQHRRIIIDPGVSLGYRRYGLLPHPRQIALGRRIRKKIICALRSATDAVFSHFHGDHVPLLNANPYQLSIHMLPHCFHELRCWSKSDHDLSTGMQKRFRDLAELMGTNLQIAEGRSEDVLPFSRAVPHGVQDSRMGTLMMTKVDMGSHVFVHASDIQLLDNNTVDQVIDWQPDIVLAAGPPLYLHRLSNTERESAWSNAVRLAENIEVVILDHHLMRSVEGAVWLDRLSTVVGKRIFCAADYMGQPRQLLEAERVQLYEQIPVPEGWHDEYVKGIPTSD